MDYSGCSNPWTSKDLLLGVQLGDPSSGLVIARRCGLLVHKDENRLQEKFAHSSSVQLTKSLQKISSLQKDLHEVEFQIHRNQLDRESQDLMHLNSLEKHLKSVDLLLNHFTAVLASKEDLLSRLQSSSTDNSLQVEAPFHKNLMDIVHSISPTLSELASNTSYIQSASSVDLTNLVSL
ncbi:hypothetical protein GBAR_LOCUS10263 [Geodia barretti]|uniref:Uncharacterized protein n=1 Tax=Geodia barretti TaxID=519541 RepID=A0AA35RS70_GEOBA|nr:hypothetical protein GBAR_LOCUS10263 [Geodia barretti]